jgi:hypothetical protein
MQIDYVKISCKEDVHICRTNFAKKMEQNSHETISQWKTYGKRLFSEDLEVRNECTTCFEQNFTTSSYRVGIGRAWCSQKACEIYCSLVQ